jgi:hypothetical protein
MKITYAADGVGGTTLTCVPDNAELLTITVAGVEGEYRQHVNIAGPSIDCGTTCVASYPNSTNVTLHVVPDTTVEFLGWSGACSGTGDCTVSMTEDRAVTATFAPVTEQEVTLTVVGDIPSFPADPGQGRVTSVPAGLDCVVPELGVVPSATCKTTLPTFSDLALHASPDDGHFLSEWGGACATSGSALDCEIRIEGETQISATFMTVALVLDVFGGCFGDECGSLQLTSSDGTNAEYPFQICTGPCVTNVVTVPDGTVITLTAVTPPGVTVEWFDACAETTGNVCVVTVHRLVAARVTATPPAPE